MVIRVAFPLIGGKNWTGGYNYLLNLLSVLQDEKPGLIVPVLLVGDDVDHIDLFPFKNITCCEILQSSAFNEANRSKLNVKSLVFGCDPEVATMLRNNNIGVVFEPAIFLGWRLGVPCIAWVPDLQHRYLPQLFSPFARLRREVGFRAQIASGRLLMVSSEDTKSSCSELYGIKSEKIRAVRFAVKPPNRLSESQTKSVVGKYSLPDRYFFMPNQFWQHKNHMLVIRALEILNARGKQVVVVATGLQLDPRNPSYVPSLKKAVLEAGLSDQLLMPGLVPYDDLRSLMQGSCAVLNPSLFEGWSTAVEEAKSAGVPLILSDLPVHKEQAGEHAIYFDRSSAVSLADALGNFEYLSQERRAELMKAAEITACLRVKQFAEDFFGLVMVAAASNSVVNG